MKYFKKDGNVYAFELDGSQDSFITKDMKKMTKNEVDRHINPDKYLSENEKYEAYLNSLKPLSRRQFMLALIEYNLDDDIESAISNIEDIKQRKKISIEYKDSQSFERLSESVLFLFSLVNIDESKINELWEYGLSL